MNTKILLTNIQRFSLHDGPGLRTTVFLKGCSLRCPWCSNPENLHPYLESYVKDGKKGIYGKAFSTSGLYLEVMKDRKFYNENGGVTFSGGEVLLQAEAILPILKRLKTEGITTAIETCLFAPTKNLELLIPYIDYFYVDMKIMNEEECRDKIKGDLYVYKKNLDILSKIKKIIIRIPVIGGYTDGTENRMLVVQELKKIENSIEKVELIKEHNLGKSKYISLGWPPPKNIGVTDDLMKLYRQEIEAKMDVPVDICKI